MLFEKKNVRFITFTMNHWTPIFTIIPESKQIIYSTLNYLSKNKKVKIYGFVIMPDHLHIIWEIDKSTNYSQIIANFKKYTAKNIISLFKTINFWYEDLFRSIRNDRKFQIWKLNSRSIKIESNSQFLSTLEYIHFNPTRGNYKVCLVPEEYDDSSARAYESNTNNFSFLTIAKLK